MGIMGLVAADLVGNWSWTVWLLVPLVSALALVTAIVLGPVAEPPRRRRGAGGVSRHLERRAARQSTEP